MPRARGNRHREEQEIQFLIDEDDLKRISVCSKFLSNNYFEMCKKLEMKLDCSVCLEELDCRHCFSMLPCGHYFHGSCLMSVKDYRCPSCRQ